MAVNDRQGQERFIRSVRGHFDASVNNLDGVTTARIASARQRALAHFPGRRRWPVGRWLPAGAVAAACLAVIIYSLMPGETAAPPQQTQALEQLELISELELYEDLEFYLWLEEYELPS